MTCTPQDGYCNVDMRGVIDEILAIPGDPTHMKAKLLVWPPTAQGDSWIWKVYGPANQLTLLINQDHVVMQGHIRCDVVNNVPVFTIKATHVALDCRDNG